MGRVVYADLFFLINFSMDFLCFFLTAKILNRRLSLIRALFGSAVGGVYANLVLLWALPRVPELILDLMLCFLMCALVYPRRREWHELPLYTVVYAAVSMTLGGFMTALFYLFNQSGLGTPPEESTGSDSLSVWVLAILAAVSAVLTLLGGKFFTRRTSRRFADVTVTYNGKSVRLSALCDSGNLLREPISGKPCIVADAEALRSLLPPDVRRAAASGRAEALETIGIERIGRIRLVPARTATGEGMLIAFRPDAVTLEYGKKVHTADAMIVLSKLETTADGRQALIPAELMI